MLAALGSCFLLTALHLAAGWGGFPAPGNAVLWDTVSEDPKFFAGAALSCLIFAGAGAYRLWNARVAAGVVVGLAVFFMLLLAAALQGIL